MTLRTNRASTTLEILVFHSPMTQLLNRTMGSLAMAGALATSYISSALAQDTSGFAGDTPDIEGLPDTADEQGIRDIIINILTSVLNFLALIAVVIVVIAGIRLLVSQGEDDAKDKAKKTIYYALLGLVIVLFARVIVGLVTVYLADQVSS
jgi:hypothetical protein